MTKAAKAVELPEKTKLTCKEFITRAIPVLLAKASERMTDKALRAGEIREGETVEAKGVHTVFSGFNDAFRKYFPESNPVVEVEKLVQEGVLNGRLAKGGYLMWLKADEVPYDPEKAKLRKISQKQAKIEDLAREIADMESK